MITLLCSIVTIVGNYSMPEFWEVWLISAIVDGIIIVDYFKRKK